MSLRRGVAHAVIIASAILLTACANKLSNNQPFNDLYLMGYNVHNLFDLEHTVEEESKNDWQYLPMDYPGKMQGCLDANTRENGELSRYYQYCIKTDWNQAKLDIKLETIKKVVTHSGRLPDILGVSEIENANVASQLAKTLGYDKFIITQSPDNRGIDVALFYRGDRLLLLEKVEHQMAEPFYHGKDTRNALVGIFQIKRFDKNLSQRVLAVSMNHWPSQGNSDPVRLEVADQVRLVLKDLQERYEVDKKEFNLVMLGDFNVIKSDVPHAFTDGLQSKRWGMEVRDLESKFNIAFPENDNPPGTYYYGRNKVWNKLDRFFVSDNLLDKEGLHVNLESFDIVVKDFMTIDLTVSEDQSGNVQKVKAPRRFTPDSDDLSNLGVSDHFPVEVKINF